MVVCVAASATAGRSAEASFTKGMCGVIDEVRFDSPGHLRTEIWGVLAEVDLKKGGLGEPEIGYLCHFCGEPDDQAGCSSDWEEIATHAGSGACVCFGDWQRPKGRVRPPEEPLGEPDPYYRGSLTPVRAGEGLLDCAGLEAAAAEPREPGRVPPPPPGATDPPIEPAGSDEAGDDPASAGCSVSPPGSGPDGAWWLAMLALAAARRPKTVARTSQSRVR
jgi:MYXO-CTERM domain-containing protein